MFNQRAPSRSVCAAAIGLPLAAFSGSAFADIIHVYEGDSIQAAIDGCASGDEIVVHPGTYVEAIDFLGKAITVRSTDPNDPVVVQHTIIYGIGAPHVVSFASEGPDTILSGFTIGFGGGGAAGGGVLIVAGSPTITNCTLHANSATNGGGLFNLTGSPVVADCTFNANSATLGGGLFNVNGSPSITGCTFSANSATDGGAIYNVSGSPMVIDCTFTTNAALHRGGIYNEAGCPTVVNCTFADNSAGHAGGIYSSSGDPNVIECTFTSNSDGGMSIQSGSPTVTDCLFTENHGAPAMYIRDGSPLVASCAFADNDHSDQWGGGLFSYHADPLVVNCPFSGNAAERGGGMACVGGSPTVVSCAFSENSVEQRGGGMYIRNCSPVVSNCTFVANSALERGGGVENDESTALFANCILWANEAWADPQISGDASVTYSNVQGGYAGEGNIDADPLFVDPINGDWRLSAGSPCIDAGHNWGLPVDEHDYDEDGNTCELFPVDLNGLPRLTDDPATPDTGCGLPVIVDMGAYEVQVPGAPPIETIYADVNGDGDVDMLDLLAAIAAWGPAPGCNLADLDMNGVVDVLDLLDVLAYWTPCP